MPVAAAIRSEQHDAVTLAAVVVVKIPVVVFIKADQRIDPAGTVEIGPLVGEAQMRLDDGAADGLEIEHASKAGEMFLRPGATSGLDVGVRLGMHGPIVERALASRLAGRMAPPARLAADHGDVGGDVTAVEQRHPEMARRIMALIVVGGIQHAAADAHAFEIGNWFGKYWKACWLHAMWADLKILAQRNGKLVVDPAVRRIPLPGIGVLGRDIGGRLDVIEILKPPRIDFADRHGSEDGRRTTDDRRAVP